MVGKGISHSKGKAIPITGRGGPQGCETADKIREKALLEWHVKLNSGYRFPLHAAASNVL
jgi:hypothetical protein